MRQPSIGDKRIVKGRDSRFYIQEYRAVYRRFWSKTPCGGEWELEHVGPFTTLEAAIGWLNPTVRYYYPPDFKEE